MRSEQVTVVCLAPLKYIFIAIFRDTPRWPFWPYLAIDSNLVKSMFFSKVRLRQKEHKNNRYKFRAWMWCYKTHPNVHCHPYFPWLDRGPAPSPRNRSVFRNCLGGPNCLSEWFLRGRCFSGSIFWSRVKEPLLNELSSKSL